MDLSALLDTLQSFLAPAGTVLGVVVLLLLNGYLFRLMKRSSARITLIRRSLAAVMVLVGLLVFVLSLPIEREVKGQILSLLGILISSAIALSSTTLLGNLLAGLMSKSMNRFRNGDLITVNDLTGRVTRQSVFHTEIQLEDSNFMSLPNLYISSHPVKVVRSNQSVISATVSLGYDVPRWQIAEVLVRAAEQVGLHDPYVYILSLGDFSVVYQVHGFTEDSSKYFSIHSQLNGAVMDALHEAGIEIVSPTFMNQRRVDELVMIPAKTEGSAPPKEKAEVSPEERVFDKAHESAKIEEKKDRIIALEKIIEQRKKLRKEAPHQAEKASLETEIDQLKQEQEALKNEIEAAKEAAEVKEVKVEKEAEAEAGEKVFEKAQESAEIEEKEEPLQALETKIDQLKQEREALKAKIKAAKEKAADQAAEAEPD
jgi:small conductance mechanosensitive channel